MALEIWGTGYEGEDIDEGSADSPPIFLLSMTKDHLRADCFQKNNCLWTALHNSVPLHPAVEICRVNRYMAIQISCPIDTEARIA